MYLRVMKPKTITIKCFGKIFWFAWSLFAISVQVTNFSSQNGTCMSISQFVEPRSAQETHSTLEHTEIN